MKNVHINILFLGLLAMGFASLAAPSRALAYTISTGLGATSDPLQTGLYGNGACCSTITAQEFNTLAAGTVSTIDGQGYLYNSPTGDSYVTIETSDGGSPASPSGSVVATSNNLTIVAGSYTSTSPVTWTFPSPVSLSSATKYFVVWHDTVAETGANAIGNAGTTASPQQRSFYSGAWHTSASQQAVMSFEVTESGGGGGGATTTIQYVDNANQDYFMGILAFFMGMTLLLWLFKGRR